MFKHQQVILCAVLLIVISLWASLSAEQQPLLLDSYDFNQQQVIKQPWRLITAHVFHLSPNHLWLNIAALSMLTLLFMQHYQPRSWLNSLVIIMFGSSIFTWLVGQPEHFVGLSALLHGLLMQGVLLEWSQRHYRRDPLLIAVMLIISAKVTLEYFIGPLGSPLLSHGDTVWVMHVGGLVSGVLAYALHRKPLKTALTGL